MTLKELKAEDHRLSGPHCELRVKDQNKVSTNDEVVRVSSKYDDQWGLIQLKQVHTS